jgi:hypothetical protein
VGIEGEKRAEARRLEGPPWGVRTSGLELDTEQAGASSRGRGPENLVVVGVLDPFVMYRRPPGADRGSAASKQCPAAAASEAAEKRSSSFSPLA